jgi:hypothetical protein
MATASVADWISAVSTAALGLVGAVFTFWQWRMTKFRPKLSSQIDAQREAIALWIVNKGRASGIIDRVQILRPDKTIERRAQFESFPGNAYRPLSLPAMASMRIIIQAPPDVTFDAGVQVLVGVGQAEPEKITPDEITSGVGLYGLKSVLPPGTSRILQRETRELAQSPSAEGLTGQHRGNESAGTAEQPPDR